MHDKKAARMLPLILTIALISLQTAESRISCRTHQGTAVSWVVTYQFPSNSKDPTPSGNEAFSTTKNHVENEFAYTYSNSREDSMTTSQVKIEHESTWWSKTIDSINDNIDSLQTIAFNDDHPEDEEENLDTKT